MTLDTENVIGDFGADSALPGRGHCGDRREPEENNTEGAGNGLDSLLESMLAPWLETGDGLTEGDRSRVSAILERAVSENTRLNYGYQWRRFARWARERGMDTLPAAPALVAAYLAERAELQEHRPATLRTAAAAIAFVHRSAELDDPCDTEDVKGILSGATRRMGSAQRQAEGLTAQAMEAIVDTICLPRRGRGGNRENVESARQRGETDVAMISLMRDAMLRVSEAAALKWEDITGEEDGTGRLLIRRSKTDAQGEGAVAFVSSQTMTRLASIRGGASEGESVFGLGRSRISGRIKRAAQAAGLGDGFSGHSPRVGMAQDLARAGTELPRLMTAGRWRSPRMPAHYTRNETIARGAVAQYYGSRDDLPGNAMQAAERGNGRSSGREDTVPIDKFSLRPIIMAGACRLKGGHVCDPDEAKGLITAFVYPLDFRATKPPAPYGFPHALWTPDTQHRLYCMTSV